MYRSPAKHDLLSVKRFYLCIIKILFVFSIFRSAGLQHAVREEMIIGGEQIVTSNLREKEKQKSFSPEQKLIFGKGIF
jgi:hypothetical protein